MLDIGSLMTVASIVAGFGVAVLVFRIQRETTLQTKWIPWADWLLIAATMVALGGVILPIISFSQPPACVVKFGSAASSLVVLLVIGYPFAILAHYRLIGAEGAARAKRSEARYNPEPLERRWVIVTFTIAILVFIARLLSLWDRMIAYFTS
jgi:hypothetical protein